MARGEGSRMHVLTIPKSWASFLHNNENKKPFCFLSEKITKISTLNKIIYTTHLTMFFQQTVIPMSQIMELTHSIMKRWLPEC